MILAGACLLASCSSFLNLEPKSSIDGNNYWKTESDVEYAATAMYWSFSKSMARGVWNWGELRGGNYTGNQPNGPDQYDIINNTMTSTNEAALWTNLYQTISRANLIIKYAPSVSMTASAKNAYLSECHAMRALCYFYIVRVWGDAPLYLEPVEEYSASSIFRPRTGKDEIMEHIISDLETAETYAQPVTSAGFKRSRINMMGIYAIMTDVYAWLHEYDKVISIMDKVYLLAPETSADSWWKTLDIPADASQEEFSQAWRAIFTKVDPSQPLEDIDRERIFYIPYSELENGINGNTSYFCNGVCKATPSDQLLSLYDPADKRYKASYSTSSPTRLTLKFWPESASFGVGGVVSDGDIVMYRMSDLVLLHAEALAATGQIDAAVKELNKIHERAGLEAYRSSEFITPEECIGAILKERTIELVGEGKYWFDLLRTGHASDIGGVDSQDKWLFPISKTHLDENHLLKQNPGYGVE